MIKVSVVTVSFNEINSIAKTVDSVVNQSYPEIEYICIDGDSSDGTKEYLQSRAGDFTHFISEPDTGIYSAMNKALALCTGDIVFFLNANDVFSSRTVLADACSEFRQDPTLEILHGKITYSHPNGYLETKEDECYRIYSINDFFKKNLQQQAFFCKRALYEELGYFSSKYKICADYDWMCKALKYAKNVKFAPIIFCVFDMEGVSVSQTHLRLREKRKIILSNSSFLEYLRYLYEGVYQLLARK